MFGEPLLSFFCKRQYGVMAIVSTWYYLFHINDKFIFTDLELCDQPNGVCIYHLDDCPPETPYECSQLYNCPVSTNKCCCYEPPPPTEECDIPNGVCVYHLDPCPQEMPNECSHLYYCSLTTNKCCCFAK